MEEEFKIKRWDAATVISVIVMTSLVVGMLGVIVLVLS